MNRMNCPEISRVSGVDFPKASISRLANGAVLHELPFGDEDIVRVDCLFKAGTLYQPQLLVASFTGQLLREGTLSHSSAEIAELLDSYGAMLGISVSYDTSCVTLHTLTRHMQPMLELLAEIVSQPAYTEGEFITYLNKRKQQYLISNEKVTTHASRNLSSALFGPKSLYGTSANLDDYDCLNIDLLKRFHKEHYVMCDCDIIVSGKVNDDVRRVVDVTLGTLPSGSHVVLGSSIYVSNLLNAKYCFFEKAESVQSAISIGRIVMPANDPDFHPFSVLNTVLGGYFGSRLMTNIREEKGYTYGIGSYILTHPSMGRFLISTQTATQFVEPAMEEIRKELKALCEVPIPKEELDAVRSYMLGENARVMDGSFSFVDAYISFLTQGIDGTTFYQESERTILSVTADELLLLARKYFDMDQFCVSIAGKKTK